MHPDNHLPIVINWHLTEACNYSCQYCYAAWKRPHKEKPLARDPDRSKALLQQLWSFFGEPRDHSPSLATPRWTGARLNIAGGEPLLYEMDIRKIIRHAREVGFKVSIITNGSLLTSACAEDIAPKLSWLGISIDSSCTRTNLVIGRHDNRQRQLSLTKLADIICAARHANPNLRIKVNTVVNAINWKPSA